MGTNLVFTGLDTDTSELIGPESYVIDTAVLTDDERDILDGCEMYGAFTGPANEIVRRVGVQVSDLWAAYEWRRAFDRGMADANLSTGVTYGSPDSVLSVAYDMGRNYGELCDECAARVYGIATDGRMGVIVAGGIVTADRRNDDGWRWRADRGGWTHCDDRAEYDEDGATCRVCHRFLSHAQAEMRMIE